MEGNPMQDTDYTEETWRADDLLMDEADARQAEEERDDDYSDDPVTRAARRWAREQARKFRALEHRADFEEWKEARDDR
jgi:hypothetical protein